MISKREFFQYMGTIYDEPYKDDETYEVFLSILKCTDKSQLNQLHDLTLMTRRQRLQYRYILACSGKELTPSQVDQYITTIDYALRNRKTT